MMLYRHTNSTLDMSSPPTHSPAIILSGVDDDDDWDDPKELAPVAVAVAVPLRLRASLPASASPQERQLPTFALLATALLDAPMP